jgi:ubiquinone/menaquinone biosynthesis C-methylase UbiE
VWQEEKQQSTLNNLRSFLRTFGKVSTNGHPAADPLASKIILDLGSGMGGLSTALALSGATVLPLDFNAEYCRITRLRGRRHGLNLPATNAAGEALPFPSEAFDIVLAMDVLEHVREPEKVLAEISRCLKQGGVCQLTAINRLAFRDPHYHVRFVNWLPRRLAPAYLRLARRKKDNSRFADRQTLAEMHYYRYGRLKQLFARQGFSLVVDSAEAKLMRVHGGWKGALQRTGLLKLSYRAYRTLFKSTYLVMAIKNWQPNA